MKVEFKSNTLVPFKDLAEGECFLFHNRVCMKIANLTAVEDEGDDDEERTTFNAVYLDVGWAVALEPEAKFLPIKMKVVEV